MSKIEIIEGRPLSYTAHDGTVIVVSVAGPVERIYTLTVNGERLLSHRNEEFVRTAARNVAEVRNVRWNAAMKTADASVTIDQIAPQYIASPLIENERQCSGLSGPSGSAANAMSEPMRRKLIVARDNLILPGRIARGGHEWEANVRMLRALARRGWLALNDPIRPRYGDLTDAGRKALARELASTGGAR